MLLGSWPDTGMWEVTTRVPSKKPIYLCPSMFILLLDLLIR